jgi:serine/threonine-protein kinase RsbW
MGSDTAAGSGYLPGTGDPGAMPPASGADTLRWHQVFPAEGRELSRMRRWLASLLPDGPARDDVLSIATELASNAVLHSRSGRPGGQFTVRADIGCGVRVEVCDEGGPWASDDHRGEEHGRGLLIVSQLAKEWGCEGDSETGWRVWFTVAGA